MTGQSLLAAHRYGCTFFGDHSPGAVGWFPNAAYFHVQSTPIMRSRKVFRIYSSLSETERLRFEAFLSSPYFNTSQRLIGFREVLENALVQQPDRDLSPEEVWCLLPGVTTSYRANGFDKLCVELLAALNDFVAVQEFRGRAVTVASHLLDAYVEHQLDEWVPSLYEALQERYRKDFANDTEGLHAHVSLLHGYGRFLVKSTRMPDIHHLQAIDQKLNEYFFAQKLELATAVEAYNKAYKSNVSLPFLDLLQEVMAASREDFPLLLQAQSLAWRLTRADDPVCYQELKAQLQQHSDALPESEVSSLYRALLNYCYARVNAEVPGWEVEVNDLHATLLENGTLLMQGQVPAGIFKNTVQGLLNTGEVENTRRFLEEWGSKILDDAQGVALLYNRGLLDFHEKRFSSCLKSMETVMRDYKADLYYGVDARAVALMAVFEMNKEEDWTQDFESRLNAFRVYLIRDQRMGEEKREKQLELIKQFRKLMSLHQEAPATQALRAEKLRNSLQSMKPVAKRQWFERQVSHYLSK